MEPFGGGGKIILQVAQDRSRKTLHAFADVADEAEAIHTDDWRPYNPWLFRDTLIRLLQSQSLPYETLVSENKSP